MNMDLDGHGAYVYTGGKPLDPALPGVVFVHGALHDHSVWILQSRYLAHHGQAVLAVDLPGHGRSGGEALGVAAAGRWLAGLIEACGVRRSALVGHSMGSLIALEAAAHLGARASALVMVGTGYPMKVSPKLLELCRRDALAAIDLVNSLSNSTHAAKPSHPGRVSPSTAATAHWQGACSKATPRATCSSPTSAHAMPMPDLKQPPQRSSAPSRWCSARAIR